MLLAVLMIQAVVTILVVQTDMRLPMVPLFLTELTSVLTVPTEFHKVI